MLKTNPSSHASQPSVFIARRRFIQLALAALGTACVGVWLQSRLFPNGSSSQAARPASFPLSDLSVGGAKAITYAGSPVLVMRTPEDLRAFSLTCTHLGCTVQWQAGQKQFYCHCHDGRFDEFGEVVSGPPPVPLEQIPVRIQGETVVVGEA